MTEITVQPEDFPSGDTAGYINVITWADSSAEACSKLSRYLATFDWHIFEVDSVYPVHDLVECSDEMESMIARAQANPEAIIVGTFHGYKVD